MALGWPMLEFQAFRGDGAKSREVTVMASKEAAEKAAARFVERVPLDLGGHPAHHGGDGLRVGESVHTSTINACIVKQDVYLA